jgi:membrane-bound lytic murein transglycosylase D
MSIRLPSNLIGTFIDKQDSIFAYKADELFLKRDIVDIKDREEATTNRTRNHYSSNKRMSHRSSRKSEKKSKKNRSKNVTIKNGDTLSEIAERNGTTVKKLKKLNGISGNSIRAGKKIRVK